MGSGSSGDMKVQAAPLMSELQKQILDQALRGATGMMQDLPLGLAYEGPNSNSYMPRTFHLGGKVSGYKDPFRRRPREEDDDSGQDDTGDDDDSDTGGGRRRRREDPWKKPRPFETQGSTAAAPSLIRQILGSRSFTPKMTPESAMPLGPAPVAAPPGYGSPAMAAAGLPTMTRQAPGFRSGMTPQTSALAQILTNPYAAAFRQGLSGRYPARG